MRLDSQKNPVAVFHKSLIISVRDTQFLGKFLGFFRKVRNCDVSGGVVQSAHQAGTHVAAAV